MFSKFCNVFLWKMDVDPFFRFRFPIHIASWEDKAREKTDECVFFFFFFSNS